MELLLLLREPVTLVFALALPIVNVVVLGGVMEEHEPLRPGGRRCRSLSCARRG